VMVPVSGKVGARWGKGWVGNAFAMIV